MDSLPEEACLAPNDALATEAENNEVMYKMRWSLCGAAVMPVLNVSSRVTWLELDDKALLDSYAVLQKGILYNTARAREITNQLWRISHNDDTRRVSPFRLEGPSPPPRCRRFAYGYALDGSECPSYLVWRQRDGQACTLLDTSTADTLVLDQNFFRPLGMQHFYDSCTCFSDLCLGLRKDELLSDLHITRDGALRIRLGAHQEHRVNHEHGQRTEQKSLQRLSS